MPDDVGIAPESWTLDMICFCAMEYQMPEMQPPAQVVKGKENQEPKEQQHSYNPNPWYSLLSCRLLSFIGTGGQAPAEHEEVRNAARTVVSSHRLSAERRFSESSMHSIRCAPASYVLTSASPAAGGRNHVVMLHTVNLRYKGGWNAHVPAASANAHSIDDRAKMPLRVRCPVTWSLLSMHLSLVAAGDVSDTACRACSLLPGRWRLAQRALSAQQHDAAAVAEQPAPHRARVCAGGRLRPRHQLLQ